jgi:hypothetical protein
MQAFTDTRDELAAFPCAGALVAGTFALMTTWALPGDDNQTAQRVLIARKIVSNLFFLRHHPALGEPLRRVMAQVHERWLLHAQDGDVQHVPAREPRPTGPMH